MIDLVFDARRHNLGNFEVGRVLPFHARRMVGPFTFLDQGQRHRRGALGAHRQPTRRKGGEVGAHLFAQDLV